jgi:hypothetical protein
VAAPSTVVLHPVAAAPVATSHTTATPAFMPLDIRTPNSCRRMSGYALSDGSDLSDSRDCSGQWTVTGTASAIAGKATGRHIIARIS